MTERYPASLIERHLGVKAATLRKWAQRGIVSKVLRGGRNMYDPDEVRAAKRRNTPPA